MKLIDLTLRTFIRSFSPFAVELPQDSDYHGSLCYKASGGRQIDHQRQPMSSPPPRATYVP